MNNLHNVKPYSDNKLAWNNELQRYELTIEYVKAHFENPYKDDGVLASRISKNSRVVYNYIYGNGNSNNKLVVTYALNYTKEGRLYLLDVLSEQMEADLLTGYNSLGNSPAINLSNGQVLDKKEIARNILCESAELIAQSSTSYFGFNILYAGTMPPLFFIYARKNMED